jgi:hypothetical protein
MHIGFWWESQKERRVLRRPRSRWKDNIKIYLRQDRVDWTGLIWHKVRDL